MKITSLGIGSSGSMRLRLGRLFAVTGVFFALFSNASAQLAISTHAGSPLQQSFLDGTGTAARFSNPSGVAVDSAGNAYIADAQNHRIRKVTPGGVVTTLAGSATQGSTDATGVAATFTSPQGIAIDSTATNLYVADTGSHKIRKIVISTGVVTTLAGTGGTVFADNPTGTLATFNNPVGIVVDSTNANLYVADTNNSAIRQVSLSAGNAVTTLAGSTAGTTGTTDATGTAARFNRPQGITANSTNLFVADTLNHSIRSIVISTGVVTTLAGSTAGPTGSGSTDATGTSARFNNPAGITLSGLNLIVADTVNHTLRQVVISSGVVTTIAGTANSSGNTDGLGTAARFNAPTGVGVDGSGNIYIADTNNQTIRKGGATVAPAITSANNTTFSISSAGTFTVTGTGSPTSTFSVGSGFPSWALFTSNAGANTATISGTPPNASGSPFTFTITANNGVSPAATQTFTLTVQQSPVITSASNASFAVGVPGTFTVTASAAPVVTSFSATSGSFPPWASLTTNPGANTATLSGTPLNTSGSPFTFTISATNGIGSPGTQSFTVNVTTVVPPVINSQPVNYTAPSGGTTASFSVSASGTPAVTGYQWQRQAGGVGAFADVSNGTPGGVTYTGATTANLSISGVSSTMNSDVFRVVVTNGSTTTSNSATLFVPPSFTNPANSAFVINQSNSFQFFATGTPAPTVTLTSGTPPNGVSFSPGVGTASVGGTPDVLGTTFLTVSATNSGGTTSQFFTLTVQQPQAPVITSATSATFAVNQPSTFTFQASGAPAPTFSLFGPSLPAGLTFTSPVLSGTPTSADGSPLTFTVVATNASGTSPSQTFTLNVLGAPPVITTNPTSTTANIGGTATFTASATGSPTPVLRWQRQAGGTSGFVDLSDSASFSGTQSTTLTITSAEAFMNGDQYRLSATNNSNTPVFSQSATLTVNIGIGFTTIAGGAAAQFNSPSGIATDFAGNVYIADTANHVIRKMTSTGLVTTIAGQAGVSGTADGAATVAARFNSPQAVAVDFIGNVYVADTFNQTIRVISIGGVVSTLAGSPGLSGAVDGIGAAARFSLPTGIVLDEASNVYVSDTGNHAIRRVQLNGAVTTFAGSMGVPGSTDSTGTSARFNSPAGLTRDSGGNIYVADSLNNTIRKITSAASVSTLAGVAGVAGVADGNSSTARFNRPSGVAVDSSGNVYVADTFSSTVRKVTSTGETSTLGGSPGVTGASDGVGGQARFNQPFGVAVDLLGNIYVADTRNHTMRKGGQGTAALIATHPTNKATPVGGTVTFTASATGAPPPGYQWQRSTFGGIFSNLSNNTTFSGVNTDTLTITNVTQDMNGQQFRVVASNGLPPVAESTAATLTIGIAPVFTSPTTASFQALQAGTFTLAATSVPAATFSATGLPSWASLNAETGVISGTPPDTNGSPFTVTVSANNGIAVTQTLTITVLAAVPTVATQPTNQTVDQGQNASFTVAVNGTPPFNYQWRRNGSPINGATLATLQLANVQPSAAGTYSVLITNVAGSAVSSNVTLTVNGVPEIASHPGPQTVLTGTSATFAVSAIGGSNLSYQWRKNGAPIAGANSSTYTIAAVAATDAGNFDVQVSNAFGLVNSSLVQLTVVTTATAPVITSQPAARSVVAGAPTTFSVGAMAAPSPGYQWRKNGVAIIGANGPTYTLSNVQAADAANYDVLISNSAGNVTSLPAGLTVLARSFAGIYFGTFSGSLGDFAIYVRDDNTGVFIGYLTGSTAPVMSLNIRVNDLGQFSFSQNAIGSLAVTSVGGTVNANGTLSGSIVGGVNGTFTGDRAAFAGGSQGVAGYYQAGSGTNGATAYTIAGANNVAFVIVQSGAASDGGRGVVTNAGAVTLTTSRSVISFNLTAGGFLSGSSTGAVAATFNGGSEAQQLRQRLVNISSRARVGTGDAVAIAGFVISGVDSKPVLIRAVGPTLGAAPFNVPGALASPRVELFSGTTSLAVNAGIGTGAGRAAIDAAGVQAAAFALGAAGTDAAILTTIAPGNYTAIVSSSTNTAGIALIEVYDLSAPVPGQKLLNIATRASTGAAENVLIAGFVVPPGSAKRVLVRGVGPGLTQFNVPGALAQPTLTLFSGSTTVASNTNWSTSPDAAAITAGSAQVGAFGLANLDSALVVTLAAGNYTAQVTGPGGATGVALIEVYELP